MRAWTSVTDNTMIGPLFNVGILSSQRYIQLITNQVIPCLKQPGYWQARHDINGAPCHTARQSRAFLIMEDFPGKVVSHFNAVELPPQLWGYLKSKVICNLRRGLGYLSSVNHCLPVPDPPLPLSIPLPRVTDSLHTFFIPNPPTHLLPHKLFVPPLRYTCSWLVCHVNIIITIYNVIYPL